MLPPSHTLRYYQGWLAAVGLLLLLVTAGGALGIMWLRHESSRLAQQNALLEVQVVELRRESATLEAHIAQIHTPQFLSRHAPPGLRPTTPEQVIWVPKENPMPMHLLSDAAPLTETKTTPKTSNQPLAVTLDLALLGTTGELSAP